MGPHNFGISGSGDHSHDVQFPEDSWNLYAMLDPSSAVLNSTQPVQAMGVFKPNALKETEEPAAVSDADAEILFVLRCVCNCCNFLISLNVFNFYLSDYF